MAELVAWSLAGLTPNLKRIKRRDLVTTTKENKVNKPESIMIEDQKYVRADSISEEAQKVDGMQYCVIRSYGAGVFCGYVKTKLVEANGINVDLVNSRRIYYWSGACSLSQLAIDGLTDIGNSKIAMVVPIQTVANVIEIIPMTEKAAKQIQGAEVWKK